MGIYTMIRRLLGIYEVEMSVEVLANLLRIFEKRDCV